jgi:hypothetical protein
MSDVLFTCTSYFGFGLEDKFEKACEALQTIVDQHTNAQPESLKRIAKWVLINEYDTKDTPGKMKFWSNEIRKRFPFVTFIQKKASQKGQAKSMNMILDMLNKSKLTYWMHWEEAWFVTRPFLREALAVMAENPSITQLQVTKHEYGGTDWMNISPSRRTCTSTWCKVAPREPSSPSQEAVFDDPSGYQFWWVHHWPLYSLRPSLNRAVHYNFAFKNKFSEDPKLWPYKFEWEFARRWLKAGSEKAVFKEGPVTRSRNHVSTYDSRVAQSPAVPAPPTNENLSTGAIVGIVVAVVVVVAAFAFGLGFGLKAQKSTYSLDGGASKHL